MDSKPMKNLSGTFQFHGIKPRQVFSSFNSESIAELKQEAVQDEETNSEKLPEKRPFQLFFNRMIVSPETEITLDKFLQYETINELISDEKVYIDDVEDLWLSMVGDAKGLNFEEAYEMLCMVSDLPDPEEEQFLNDEFNKLTNGKESLSFYEILGWSDIKNILDEEAMTMEEISELWRKYSSGDLNAKMDRKQFIRFNRGIDQALDEQEYDEEVDGEEDDTEDDMAMDSFDIANVWSKTYDPTTAFDSEPLKEITEYFNLVKNQANQFSFQDLLDWEDIQGLMDEGLVNMKMLEALWKEASPDQKGIDYDTFLRLNIKLDFMVDEVETKMMADAKKPSPPASTSSTSSTSLSTSADTKGDTVDEKKDAELFYRTEFRRITNGGKLMRLDMLLDWQDVADLVAEGDLTEKQVTKMFEGLPQEPMGIPSTVYGINEDAFVYFNTMLDIVLSATSGNTAKEPSGNVPSVLVSEPSLPMLQKDRELKMGSLGGSTETQKSGDGSSASESLTPSELEMMNLLDKADNMLNSGSYSDFDELIGDMNDPRLEALREKRDNSLQVRGQLDDILEGLLQIGRQQSRCGLDRPSEEDAAKIRDYIQAVIENSPKIYDLSIPTIRSKINGKWKLLYTNSEMFSFYNGVTGFTNVFPATKFQDLSIELQSDGYLSEGKYYETLVTPMGTLDATVYTNWELVKEMSFMTNENSVVLRNYCAKVTAGPMTYEAQENWKSLRTMAMNELIFVNDDVMIARNCGALRIYFLYERIK